MAKFVIACPSCGRYTEASTGFFAKKQIPCSCGYTIQVKTDRMTTRECPHCGNMVAYDQAQGNDAVCPVCHNQIMTEQIRSKMVEFICPSCNCHLSAAKEAASYTCPLCDTVIDVQNQVSKYQVKNQGLASVIKYEGGNDVFVWKHPIEDFNLGTQLIVHESQEALFFRDGKALDLFGAGRYTLATQNLPLLENLYKLPTNTDEVFHSEIYFINMTTQMGIKWGTDSKVRLFDPASGLYIEIGASGNFNLRVDNARKLVLKLVGTEKQLAQKAIVGEDGYETNAIVGKFKALVMNVVKSHLARVIREENINILEIDSYLDTLSAHMRDVLNTTMEDYGLCIPEFYITTIVTPDDDPNFRRLKQQFADKTLLVREEQIKQAEAEAARQRQIVEAQTEAQLQMVKAQGEAEALKIRAEAEAQGYRMQAMAEADEMRMKGYTYQQETARQVGMEAMQNGLTGGEGVASGGVLSGIGDLASLGVGLGAMGGVVNMTKDALQPMMTETKQMGAGIGNILQDGWNCACGASGLQSRFCPNCGTPRPENMTQPKDDATPWNCTCGATQITSRFCPECGKKRP